MNLSNCFDYHFLIHYLTNIHEEFKVLAMTDIVKYEFHMIHLHLKYWGLPNSFLSGSDFGYCPLLILLREIIVLKNHLLHLQESVIITHLPLLRYYVFLHLLVIFGDYLGQLYSVSHYWTNPLRFWSLHY